ncbi:hypothetical protein AMTRI_Chr10g5130 [Amborella trichopoda]
MVCVISKIQPSQLAEELRKAARLFKNLHLHIQSTLGLHTSLCLELSQFLDDAMFPSKMKPAMWWPKRAAATPSKTEEETTDNGWSTKMEREMVELAGVVRERNTAEYMMLSKLVLNCNREMVVAGPILIAAATVGSALGGSTTMSWLVWMVFEMYRNNTGFYQLLNKSLSSSLDKPPVKREHAELETRPSIGNEHLIIAQLGLLPLLKETSSTYVHDKFSNSPSDDDAHFKGRGSSSSNSKTSSLSRNPFNDGQEDHETLPCPKTRPLLSPETLQ